jgi:hypothetical protein
MHCFPLLFSHHVSEGIDGKNRIVDILRLNAQGPP